MTTSSITNRLVVDNNGRASFSGLGSGIDFQSAVESLVTAKRVPIDRLEKTVKTNSDKIRAYTDLSSKAAALRDSIDALRGKISVGGKNNIFENKQAFASSSRANSYITNPYRQAPSLAENLLGVTVSNSALTGSYDVEIIRTAKAERDASNIVSSSSAALNGLIGFTGGNLGINNKFAVIDATASLQDVRDTINNMDADVTASILTVADGQYRLVVTANDTGTPILYSLSTPLNELGIIIGDEVNPANQLQAAQTALLSANGLRDLSRKQSDIFYSPGAALSTLTPGLVTGGAQSFQVTDSSATPLFTVNYDNADSINDIANAINAAAAVAMVDVTATVEQVNGGAGGFRLVIKDSSGDTINLSNDTGGFISAFSFTDPAILERSSNTVTDVISGVTLNLFQAEGGTNIKIDVEQNLSAVKNQIATFVEAYNDLVQFINQQTIVDPVTGEPTEDTGILFGDRALADVRAQLGNLISGAVKGVSSDFSTISQAGIVFRNDQNVSDPLLKNLLTIDEGVLDGALLNHASDIRKLFSFTGTTNNALFNITGFSGDMQYSASGVSIDYTFDGSAFTAASIGGDSSAVQIGADGRSLIILKGAAKGMTLFYSGTSAASGSMTANYTVGFGATGYTVLDRLVALDTGVIDTEIDTLKELNTKTQERIDTLLIRLEEFRQTQLDKFIRMEQSLSRAKNIMDSLSQSVKALTPRDN